MLVRSAALRQRDETLFRGEKKVVRSQSQKDRAKDKRLQSKYGITLARQNELRQQQNNRCKTCGVEFTPENPPCTDHFHYRIHTRKLGKQNWESSSQDERGAVSAICIAWNPTKTAAIIAMKKIMGPRSVRGLLCRRCNRGLGYIERFFNAAQHPENLLPIIDYLQARLKS